MPSTISINGVRLDEMRLFTERHANNTLSYLSYPTNRFRVARVDRGLDLCVPASLAVKLFRTGVLPQDATRPVEVSIDDVTAGQFVLTEVRYPSGTHGPDELVCLALGLLHEERPAALSPSRSRRRSGTYVTDITHYLDEAGDVPHLPRPARQLASFLTLLIEAATAAPEVSDHKTGIRCRTKNCRGIVRTAVQQARGEITWRCPSREHNGIIRNWQQTKWNRCPRANRL